MNITLNERQKDLLRRVGVLQDSEGNNWSREVAIDKIVRGLENGDFWEEEAGRVVYENDSATLLREEKDGSYTKVQTISGLTPQQKDSALVNVTKRISFTKSQRETSMGSFGSAYK